ncbi:hypothetical protein COL154_008035 [Colletotrichum chrysophilum]|uniref:uncharacterized protein n=1 Tax=Colletotrichum chrysophilum TaxID=1836956 RepID=UPI002301F4DB|nr:uncharacterized protein COL26b_004893 [Colletotrichum chrysophilum]KAJ0346543.1 hypothetical protein KNSL1_007399 [Colletotrichum chrysophilum]KAJ0359833.1 hypothetical protein COL154_008035 [Colletotrichum chrysophilum]KAJ0376840.1 hypothetical protein COL26b_004893 [Colletotrichum chrysophilum]
MALHHDPPVNDRLDQYDHDGDPGRLVPEPPWTCALEIDERSDLTRLSLHIGCASDGCDEMDCSTITENDYSDDGGCHTAPSWTSPVDSNMLPILGSLPNMMQKVGQGPEYVVKLLERTSKLDDSRSHIAHTQPTPFVNRYAQHIAESTTIYDHSYNHFDQQPSASPTKLIEMSAATSTRVGRLEGDNTTHTEIDPLLTTTMAVTSTGWPYGAQPGCAAPHDTMENMFTQGSPLSELYDSPDEMAWATYINEEMLAPSDFTMNYPYPTDTSSPEDIISDPTVQYDVEQSLFSFNDPLPDLSTSSDYLSGDQLSVSYFGSANTSPFEQSLDYIPDDMDFLQDSSSMPVWPLSSTTASPLPTSTTSPTSPDAADHPYRCTTDNCTKTFRKEAQLKQHQRVHRKSLVCTICRAERHTEHKFAQVRDLERHLQARHPEVAQTANVRSEIRECPHPGCDHRGRRDNVSRHHESKHGKKLKWKRGVPHVVG